MISFQSFRIWKSTEQLQCGQSAGVVQKEALSHSSLDHRVVHLNGVKEPRDIAPEIPASADTVTHVALCGVAALTNYLN